MQVHDFRAGVRTWIDEQGHVLVPPQDDDGVDAQLDHQRRVQQMLYDEYLAGMLAKSLAGRAARIAATHCQQVLAGIGFTAEQPFHRYLARALVLESVLGSTAELRLAIGQQLVSAGIIPRLVEL